MSRGRIGIWFGIILSVSACGARDGNHEELTQRIAALEERLAAQEDIEQIRTLQFAYNYYNSGRLYKQLLDLVSEQAGTIEIAGRGVFKGKAGFAKNVNPDPDGTVCSVRGVPVSDPLRRAPRRRRRPSGLESDDAASASGRLRS